MSPSLTPSVKARAGCRQCHDSGFRGRLGIFEIMEVDGRLRRMIHTGAPTHELRAYLRKIGVLSLREEGVQHALQGKTSLEEVLRVTTGEDATSQDNDDQAGDNKGAAA